ncbi:MAG: YceI family protein [Blastocatellia bacterium]|nr:YceI family protein [Blastocatellia bacterium]
MPSGAGAQTAARSYTISASESNFWVSVGKAGLFSALGHEHEIGIKSFKGRAVVPQTGASGGSLELEIETKSLVVLDKEVDEKDRGKIFTDMHNEVLESEKFPQCIFKSVSVTDLKKTGEGSYNLVLNGDLTLHGVTKRIAIPLTATITAAQLRAVGKYTLKQTDFGIRVFSAGGGTVKVKNEVVVNFDIIAKNKTS